MTNQDLIELIRKDVGAQRHAYKLIFKVKVNFEIYIADRKATACI